MTQHFESRFKGLVGAIQSLKAALKNLSSDEHRILLQWQNY
jgi:hypothetical protein